MTELEDSFAKLLGTQPSEKDREDLRRVRDAKRAGRELLWELRRAAPRCATIPAW